MPPRPTNLLIVSDLHLGGPLRPPFGFKALRQVARLDRELSRFLTWWSAHPQAGDDGLPLPWKLVLNGDTIDFLHMDLRPDADGDGAPDDDEQLHGLAFAAGRSRWKLDQIARFHRRSFRALGRFVEAGNELVFIIGNHDADLFFRGVREGMVEHIVRYAADPRAARALISFSPWFFYEEGRAYVEHGHRFDPYATFPDPLSPVDPDEPRRLAPNFGHWGLRYFCNRITSFPVHDVDTWGIRDFLRWAGRLAGLPLLRAFWQSIVFLVRYLVDAARDAARRRTFQAARKLRRRARLTAFATRYGMPLARVLALDNLRLPHVGASVGRMMQALYMDQAALAAAFVAGTVVAFTLLSPSAAAFMTMGLLGAAWHTWRWLARLRPAQDVHPLLARLARRIAWLTGARVVVFGHTHRPVLRALGGAQFLNPGSWEHLPRQRMHRADEPCDCAARFGVVTGSKERTRASLMRWCRRVRAPLKLVTEPGG